MNETTYEKGNFGIFPMEWNSTVHQKNMQDSPLFMVHQAQWSTIAPPIIFFAMYERLLKCLEQIFLFTIKSLNFSSDVNIRYLL